jgi:hypothetical protein
MPQKGTKSSLVFSLGLWCLLVAIYLSFPTRLYYWDGIVFAQAIEDAPRLNASLVHPNHLIYNFAGYAFYKLLRMIGFDIRALTALQILNSFLSAACAGVLFAILLDTLRSLYLAMCLTLLFAFSATWWKFSTDANAYIPSVLFLLVSFYLVLPNRKPRPWLVAVTFFVSMAFHQLAVLMWPVLAVGVYWQDHPLPIRRRVLNVVSFSVLAAVLIVAAYSYLFYLAAPSFDLAHFLRWTSSYSPDADTHFNFWSNLQYSLRGQARLFFGGRFNLLKGLMNPFLFVLIPCLIGAVLFLLFEILRNLRSLGEFREVRLEQQQKTVLVLCALWVGIYLVFLFFWLPQNTFYRLFYLPPVILLLGLGLSSVANKLRRHRILATFVIAVALANFLFLIYPFSHVEKYPPLVFARQLNREWPAGTQVFYTSESSDAALVRYFTPNTKWKRMHLKFMDDPNTEMSNAYKNGGTVWFETSAIEGHNSTPEGRRWLNTHMRKETWRELNDGAHLIQFVQVNP